MKVPPQVNDFRKDAYVHVSYLFNQDCSKCLHCENCEEMVTQQETYTYTENYEIEDENNVAAEIKKQYRL